MIAKVILISEYLFEEWMVLFLLAAVVWHLINYLSFQYISVLYLGLMQNPTQYILIILLVVYAIIKRVRRAFYFQKYSKPGLVFKIALFSLISLALLWWATANPIQYMFDLGGLALGIGLVYFGVKHMVMEKRKDGLYFRTHVWVEVAILSIFFIRIAYRFYTIYTEYAGAAPDEVISHKLRYASDPFTGIVFFLLCTYYIAYYTYIYRKGVEMLSTDSNS